MFNFDQHIERRNTDSEKWGKYTGQDIIPMWIADTDFQSPPCVIDALHNRVEHGIFGYGEAPQALYDIFIDRMKTCYNWQIKPEWLVFLPGLVCGLNLSVRAFTSDQQRTLTLYPIYPPFTKAAKFINREQLHIPVKLVNQRWLPDFNSLEPALSGQEKLLMLCNPLNPGGTVFSREELLKQLQFAIDHELLICSDEIHCDLILNPEKKHIPIASLNEEAEQRTITLMAPSKTYNIAGLGASIVIIPNAELRQKYINTRQGIVPSVNVFAFTAAEAAYRGGEQWLAEQLSYLKVNHDITVERINSIPGLSLPPFDATFLAWIDASNLPVDNPHHFFEQAGVGLSPGADFGHHRFVRMNIGCTRKTLYEALNRMEKACRALF